MTLVKLQSGFVAADESIDILSCHKRPFAIVVLCIKSLKVFHNAFVTYLFSCSFYCSLSMCNYMPHLFCNANNTPYETGNQWLNFFPLTTGHACTWVQLSSVHIGCICQSVGISFVSPARVHHGEGEAREAGAVFGVCFFMYLLSLLIESCGFVCSAGPCLLWHSEKWHVHTGCNLAWHTC